MLTEELRVRSLVGWWLVLTVTCTGAIWIGFWIAAGELPFWAG
jgi:hypothetical protein